MPAAAVFTISYSNNRATFYRKLVQHNCDGLLSIQSVNQYNLTICLLSAWTIKFF